MGCSGSKFQQAADVPTPLVTKDSDDKIAGKINQFNINKIELNPEVTKILEEINLIDIQKIELDSDSQEYLETVGAYIYCFDRLEAEYETIDPDRKLAKYDMPDIKEPIQQVSNKTGKPVKNIVELYEAAQAMLPVFEAKIESLIKEQLTASSSSSPEESSSPGVEFKLAPLKDQKRALEKAQDDYSKNEPGPAVSWLYDIVRGSLLFDKAELLFKFLQLLRADKSIAIVKSKNRFRNPTLSGYRDFNMQIEITNEQDGSKHICELQLHIKDIKELAIVLKSHSHYEFFRVFYAGATDSLKERMGDLRAICKGGSLDMQFLSNVVKNPLDVDRMTRLANLFAHYMNEYQLAIVITNAAKELMEPQEWYTRLGNLLQSQDKLEEALTLHQTSLDIRLKALGPEHTDVAQSYNNMAIILQRQGKLEEAMKRYNKALGIYLKALGPNHTDVAQSYGNMAIVLIIQGKLEEATTLYKKALDIYLKAHGPNHTDVAHCYNNMAVVLKNQGKLEEALKLYNNAVDIRVKALGPEHTDVAQCYNNMGVVLEKQGKLDEAMTLYKKALDINLKANGPVHTNVADLYINMACVLDLQGKLEEAMVLYKEALYIRVNVLGPENPAVASCYNNMAFVLKNLGKFEESLKLYKISLDIRIKTLGPEHTEVAWSCYLISHVLNDQRKLEEALMFAQKALSIFLKTLGPLHPKTISCDRMVAYLRNELCDALVGTIINSTYR